MICKNGNIVVRGIIVWQYSIYENYFLITYTDTKKSE